MKKSASNDGDRQQAANLAQLQTTLNVIPAYAWYTAPSGGLTFVNKRTGDYLGLPKDHPLRFGIDIGGPWDAHIPLLHPDDQEESRKAWATCLRTGEAAEFSQRVRNAQGDYRWFLSRAEPLRASDGTLLQWVGVNLDIEELKRAEQASRESELKLRQITETVPGLVWSNGPDGEPTHINQRMLDYSGRPFEEFKHRGWEAFVYPADFPETAEAFWHAIQSGTSYQGIMRLRRADGAFRWHHARCDPLCDQQGRIIQWYGLAVDIDERKQAEERLRRSEAYLAEAERLSHSGSAAYNQTEILYFSEEAHRIFGFDPLQGIPSREAVWQRMHPDDQSRTNEIIQRAVREKRSFGNEFRVLRPDGTIIHIEAINHPVFSESGEFIEIVVTGLDVTDRKRAEEALRESELKLRKIIETVPSMLWSAAPDGEPTRVNQRVLDYGGLRFEDFVNLGWKEFLHPEDFPETARAFYHAIQTGEPYEAVHRLRRADGQYRWYHARGEPLRDEKQRVIQWYGLSIDIDERKRAEDGLRRSEAYLAAAERLSHTGGWAVNRKGERTVVYWSEESYRIFGLDPLHGHPDPRLGLATDPSGRPRPAAR